MATGSRVGTSTRRVRPEPSTGPAAIRKNFQTDFVHRSKTLKRLASSRGPSVDDVHEMRVTTRRLRAAFSILRHATEKGRFARHRRELRSLGRVLGTCRALDIAIRDARAYHVDATALEKQRARAGRTLGTALKRERVRTFISDLRKLEKDIGEISFERLSPWLESLEWELAYRLARRPRSATERHELRIELKKVRYVIEALGRRSPSLQKLQDQLGKEHDLIVLQSLVGRNPKAARDQQRARTRAGALIRPAINSAMRNLRAIRRDLKG